MRTRRRLSILIAALLATGTSAAVPTLAAAATCTPKVFSSGYHEKVVDGPVEPLDGIPEDARTVPTWSGSFTSGGRTYPYVMVGTDPAAGSATTTVPVIIVPLRLTFSSTHCVLGSDEMATDVAASPMFQPTPTAAGTTQYLDALQRGNFWSSVGTISPDYHVLLGTPRIAAVQTLSVPAAQGISAFDQVAQRPFGVVGDRWLFLSLRTLIGSLQLDPRTLAIFVSSNTYLTSQNPADCFAGGCSYFTGFHDAVVGNHSVTTYAFASVADLGDELPPWLDIGTAVVSHEIIEWANDPFVHGQRVRGQVTSQVNLTPGWTSPYYSFGCSTALEVADPIEGGPSIGATPVGGSTVYVLADMAFLSWFARESPSTAILGRYDAGGVFATYAPQC